jgi:trehalose-phosphatase
VARADPTLPLDRIDAVIFDMDGVVTDTVPVHAAAWKRLFDEYLAERSRLEGEPFVPFDIEHDYRLCIDGRPRYDGARAFLASRGISVPEGSPSDPPDRATVCGLGNRKDRFFRASLREGGVRPFPGTMALVNELHTRGVKTAIISASRNMSDVLRAAGVDGLFAVRVDGVDADRLGLAGKPDPAVFLEAARRLGVEPTRAAVVEDALAGAEAGRRGRFGLVVGVDRVGDSNALRRAGADVVVGDLGELHLSGGVRSLGGLPSALDRLSEILARFKDRPPSVFLDYDGTLTPIVRHPSQAVLGERTRHAVRELARRCPVAVVSGRDLDDVRRMVAVEGIWYAGSHGFDILGPDGRVHRRGSGYEASLRAAGDELDGSVRAVPGAWVERKRFALAVHTREVTDDRLPDVEAIVGSVAARYPQLRRTGGKRVFELRPAEAWDKGAAILWLLELLGRGREGRVPVYIGDDETDEDGFQAVGDRGIGIAVRGEGDDRPTAAEYALADPDEVSRFLTELARAMGGGR